MSVKKEPFFYEDPQQLKNKVAQALKYYEVPEEINLEVLEEWIAEANNPIFFIIRVFEEAYFESETEAGKLIDLLARLWNVTPRKELDGMSPQQKLSLVMAKPKK